MGSLQILTIVKWKNVQTYNRKPNLVVLQIKRYLSSMGCMPSVDAFNLWDLSFHVGENLFLIVLTLYP
jgi:hypothetical protein